ncbi:uncharacterized protein [Musca autumnalis]|uniref:uncharacterized protein n=1 Tax=Musca autumnalis TaxID=221902 RepID=UPI003CF4D41D
MPIKEIPVKPGKGSNNLNANYMPDSLYEMSTRMPNGNGRNSTRFPTTTTASSDHHHNKNSKNKIVINYENMSVSSSNTNNLPYLNGGQGNGQQINVMWMNDKNRDDNGSVHSQDSCGGYNTTGRLSGGATRGQQELDKLLSISPSQCKIKAPGMKYFEPNPKVNVISLSMMKSKEEIKKCHLQCHLKKLQTKALPPNRRTRGTQSLYRESSAQTLPYLPAVSNDPDELESMELFKLPTILPCTGPPCLYEVEVLERARKRWAFAKALKENFRKQLAEARQQQVKIPKHDHILEAFEWEHWIEREENIQECQMLRLEILIRMFDQRERQMRTASYERIQQSYERIEAERQEALRKNEVAYSRAMRRLEMQHKKQPRHWRKEHISQGFADPTSEFYAPKMRHGIDPSRRHFVASRKGFDMRMDDLERKAVRMDPRHLKCPFAKLRSWSKPKELVQEVEQNFCSENNLRKLYESLRNLRETSNKPKTTPICLKAKEKPKTIIDAQQSPSLRSPRVTITDEVAAYEYPIEESSTEDSDIRRLREEQDYQDYLQEVREEKQHERQLREHLQREMGQEEFEVMIQAYEGNTIGWLMRFLSEEMCRLKEQRKLHFYTMLAKQERWHREAAEAGLRQKENVMRDTYEKLYQECGQANFETAEKYLHSLLQEDVNDYAEQQAESHVVTQARELDKEISEWLHSFQDVQTPMNYHELRHALKDIVIPDADKILYRLERDDCVRHVINEVLLPQVFAQLEAYDISFSLTTNFVDRLIDNDLQLSSSDCCSECDCSDFCSCTGAQKEARAILRKLIRHSVPGRRWRTSTERMVDENVKDILDEVFERAILKGPIIETDQSMMGTELKFSYLDLGAGQTKEVYFSDVSGDGESSDTQDYCKIKALGESPPTNVDDITKILENEELLLLGDTDKLSADKFLMTMDQYDSPQPRYKPTIVHPIPSTHDISSVWDFDKTANYCRTSSDDGIEELEEEEYKVSVVEEHESLEENSVEEEILEEEATLEEEHIIPVEIGHRKIDSQVRFDDEPKIEEIIEPEEPSLQDGDNDDDAVGGVIPVSFSYDPTVKFTVPVPSNFEMTMEQQSDDTEEIEEK